MSFARVGSIVHPVRCSIPYNTVGWKSRRNNENEFKKKINGNGLKFKQPYIYLFKCNSLDLLRFCIKYFFFLKNQHTHKKIE